MEAKQFTYFYLAFKNFVVIKCLFKQADKFVASGILATEFAEPT